MDFVVLYGGVIFVEKWVKFMINCKKMYFVIFKKH